MKLSEKILHLRKQHGLSQEDLAEKLNVSRQAVSRWEVGSAQPDASNVLQLSQLFGVTADYLLNDNYKSDQDVPAVKNTENCANQKIKKIIALCVSAFGLSGNFVIYILSRCIEVPHSGTFYITYDKNGNELCGWDGAIMRHSYIDFIHYYDLEFLATIFWILFAIGLIVAFMNRKKIDEVIAKHKEKKTARNTRSGHDESRIDH